MTIEQLYENHIALQKETNENAQRIAALEENLKSTHKRLDKVEDGIAGFHKFAATIEIVANEQKNISANLDKMAQAVTESLKAHGIRLGEVEKLVVTVEVFDTRIQALEQDSTEQKGKGSKMWNKTVEKIFYIVAMIILYVILGQLGL